MTKILLRKALGGLIAADDEASKFLTDIKAGDMFACEITRPRNLGFHRKWFALLTVMFEQKSLSYRPLEYKGKKVEPCFERFRKEVVIKTGRYEPVYGIDGEIRLEANSVSFANMKKEDFELLYSDTIDVALELLKDYSKDELDNMVNHVLEFC